MKKCLLVVACSLGMFSFNAIAGGAGGCIYGSHGDDSYAKIKEKAFDLNVVAEHKVDPTLLTLMKKHQSGQLPAEPISTFN